MNNYTTHPKLCSLVPNRPRGCYWSVAWGLGTLDLRHAPNWSIEKTIGLCNPSSNALTMS